MPDDEKHPFRESLSVYSDVFGVIGGVVFALGCLLWVLTKLPWQVLAFVIGVGSALLFVWMMCRVYISNNRPLESIGTLDIAGIPVVHTPPEKTQVDGLNPEITLATLEIKDRTFSANDESFMIILARFYYMNLNARPRLSVRGHVFFSQHGKQIKQVFNAAWNNSSHLHVQFKTGDAHDLLVGVVVKNGSKMVAYEYGDPKPILTSLPSNEFDVAVELIGSGGDQFIARSRTTFTLTLIDGKHPKIENVKHSARNPEAKDLH